MSCEQCEGICKRRGAQMPESHKKLCQQQVAYSKIWDGKYGVVDETVFPDSILNEGKATLLPKSESKRSVPTALKPKRDKQFRSGKGAQTFPQSRGLGDVVESALSSVGITSERVEKWLGRPCGCKQRKDKLNKLSSWASGIISGKTENAVSHLDEIMED